jgi:hypothetical protein
MFIGWINRGVVSSLFAFAKAPKFNPVDILAKRNTIYWVYK